MASVAQDPVQAQIHQQFRRLEGVPDWPVLSPDDLVHAKQKPVARHHSHDGNAQRDGFGVTQFWPEGLDALLP